MEELKEIITEAPSGKAIGPSEVSNEMIKRLGTKATEHMLKIMNACMKLQTVPKSWKKGNVYPIAKKRKFSGKLDET